MTSKWKCTKCQVNLEINKVMVAYLDLEFPIDLPSCPKCGLTLADEELALGKMLEVEKLLEDK